MGSFKLWKWAGRSTCRSELSPGKRSLSAQPAPSVGEVQSHVAPSGQAPQSNIFNRCHSVTRSESESLKKGAACSTSSTPSDQISSRWEKGSSSGSVGTITATSCEHVGKGEITPDIMPHVDTTVPPSLFNELEQIFKNFDANKDGKLSASDLRYVLQSFGENASEEEAMIMLKDADEDGDGYIDLDDFIAMSTRQVGCDAEVARCDELKAAFNMFDMNREGYITAEKLRHVLNRLERSEYTIEECRKMINAVDLDGDGCVNFEDFKRMMA